MSALANQTTSEQAAMVQRAIDHYSTNNGPFITTQHHYLMQDVRVLMHKECWRGVRLSAEGEKIKDAIIRNIFNGEYL